MKTIIRNTVAVLALLFGSLTAQAQVKIGSNPTVIEAQSNLEVEASTPNRQIKVDKTTGQLTIKDGTEGTGKVLTSDANGGASWQTNAALRIPETVWIGEQQGTYTVTTFTGTFNQLKDRIPLNPRTGSLAGYNASTKEYIIQESGYYRIHTGAYITGTLPPPRVTFIRLYLHPSGVLQQFNNITTLEGPRLSTFWEGFMSAGTAVNTYVIANENGGGAQSVYVSQTFLSVTKLF